MKRKERENEGEITLFSPKTHPPPLSDPKENMREGNCPVFVAYSGRAYKEEDFEKRRRAGVSQARRLASKKKKKKNPPFFPVSAMLCCVHTAVLGAKANLSSFQGGMDSSPAAHLV